jgi:uncharacterized membrane protein YdjX (TVP38/TMEM64 family)
VSVAGIAGRAFERVAGRSLPPLPKHLLSRFLGRKSRLHSLIGWPRSALAIYALRDTLTFETLRENRDTLLAWRDANYLAAAAGYMLIYVIVIALSVPGGAVMTLTGGFLFGLVAGTAMTVVAATMGATLIFVAAKAGFGDALHRRLTAEGSESVLKRLEAGLRANAFNYLLMIRLVPAFPFWLINLAAAFLAPE